LIDNLKYLNRQLTRFWNIVCDHWGFT